jgi:phytoene dehydrogenase-like protein
VADAIVVGAGPNGLAAAIELARAGRSVTVLEAGDTIGGGTRSAELTLPGFTHDVCSTIHALGAASPFFRSLQLGVEWVHPGAPLAHPLDDGRAVILEQSLRGTARRLGHDGPAYWRLFHGLVGDADTLVPLLLKPPRPFPHPLLMAGFGFYAVRSARAIIDGRFRTDQARALLAGIAAHSILPLEQAPSAGFLLTLALLAHTVGWPLARGGSQRIADALAERLRSLGGEIRLGERVTSRAQLDGAHQVLLEVTPRQLVSIAGDALRPGYRRAMERYRYGPGLFKLDYALDGPVPWTARECWLGGTVHVGGTFEEIAASERAVARGEHPERPFVIAVQPTLFDRTRAPEGKHILWAYCHVPNGSSVDMTGQVEAQLERFAPGFRDRILSRRTFTAAQVETYDASFVGGDINGGLANLRQFFARPVASLDPYRVPGTNLFLCSAATPPSGGVHGMCGYHAARSALRRLR